MKQTSFRIFWLVVLLLAAALLLSYGSANAHPPAQPPIPHPLDGFADCVTCHSTGLSGAPKFPADHEGRTNEMCQACHHPAANAPAAQSTPNAAASPASSGSSPAAAQTPASSGDPPRIPHPLQGRDNCLACHQTGLGGAPKLPGSHSGRGVETCQTCHQRAQPAEGEAPQILPTPIAYPKPSGDKNTCVSCHLSYGGKVAAVVQEWQSSIHAQRGVSCADCHGGDPTSMDRAMTLDAGFVGVPRKVDIPALCASCHARVETMRQYDLPTDQWAKYQQSVHGKKLAQGDTNVATCFTCHDGHGTKEVNDPSAQVYPLNVPGLCASCHANAELMKPYGIPTNQYALYTQSVHGVALLQKQDTRAPSCATCHGTHGAAPPGFQEVANVCGSCHTATQDYYLKSQHASNAPGTPKCVTCHGRYDVMAPTDAMFEGNGVRDCGSCHTGASAQVETVQSLGKSLKDAAASVDQASAAVQRAAGSALIVAPEEVKLAAARTELISARAAQHTLDLQTVKTHTDKATAAAKEVLADSDKAIADSVFRRQFMGLGLAIMALAIGSLYIIRRELYKELPKN